MLKSFIHSIATKYFIIFVISIFPVLVIAAPPYATFNGKVLEIFVNNGQVLLSVSGGVRGSCTGTYGPYNLTFDFTDPVASYKFALIKDAFQDGKTIAGTVNGCGSSNINKLSEVSVF